jgi:zinc protease
VTRPLLALALVATVTGIVAMADPPAGTVFPYPAKTETLGNGLTVIMIPMPSKGLVSYYSIVRTGSRDEWEPGHTGFAHFFEHMMFRGTKNYPADAYDKMITAMGADANAYTTDDYTAYHLSFTSDDLETVMKLEADRFQHLWYEVPAFQTEAGAVYGEYRKNRTSPWEQLFETLQNTAFTTHTYKHTTMGFEADIKAMPTMYDYSRSFFERYYRPENVVLVVAGDIKMDHVMALATKYYGGWAKGYTEPKIPIEPAQTAERTATVRYGGRTLPILAIAWKGERFDPANTSMVSAMLLGDLAFGENSDLYRKLVIKESRVSLLGADFGMNRDPGLWTVYTMVKDEADVEKVRDEIYAAAARFQSTPPDAKKLADLKSRLKYGFLMGLDTPDRVAGALARHVAITGGIGAIDALYATYDRITPADIQAAAQKYLVPATRTVVTLKGGK